jgi:hypothetical protein
MDVLLNAKTDNGDGTDSAVKDGGFRVFRIYGTWGGAIATLSVDFNNSGTFVFDSDYTASGVYIVQAKVGMTYRLTLSNVGATTSLSAEII